MPSIATATDIRIGNSLASEVRLGSNLVWSRLYDVDAANYFAAVEAADGQILETAVKVAINNFVVGCKADGIWSALRTCFLMKGPRTVAGLMIALRGTNGTNNFFTSADYERRTGLKGDGTTKYIELNRNNNLEAQNSKHFAVEVYEIGTWSAGVNRAYLGGTLNSGHTLMRQVSATQIQARVHSGGITPDAALNTNGTGFVGWNRSNATEVALTYGITTILASASQTPASAQMRLFSLGNGLDYSDGRIGFFSMGNTIDMAKLRSRSATLTQAIWTALTP